MLLQAEKSKIEKSKPKSPSKRQSKVNKPGSPSKKSKSKKAKKSASPSKSKSSKVKKSAVPTKTAEKSTPSLKCNGKQFICQRPKLLQINEDNDNNNNVCSSDEDDQIESVAAQSRITYAIAMNNRLAQEGCSGSSSRGGGSNVVNEPSVEEVEVQRTTMSAGRYPKRARRHVDYKEQLDTPDDDCFICKYLHGTRSVCPPSFLFLYLERLVRSRLVYLFTCRTV